MSKEQTIVEGLFSELLQKPDPKKDAMVNTILDKAEKIKAQFDAGSLDYSQYRSEVRRLVVEAREIGLTRKVIIRLLGGGCES